jgi:hypothetical protein
MKKSESLVKRVESLNRIWPSQNNWTKVRKQETQPGFNLLKVVGQRTALNVGDLLHDIRIHSVLHLPKSLAMAYICLEMIVISNLLNASKTLWVRDIDW